MTDGQYLSTRQAVPNKGTATPQVDSVGNQRATLETYISGERSAGSSTGSDYMNVRSENTYTSITTATTTLIKTGSGMLKSITILGGTGGLVSVFDNTAGSGTALIPAFTAVTTTSVTLTFDAVFATGLTIVTAAATLLSVSSS